MVDIVISATIIVIIMLLFVFVLLKNIIKRIGQNAKKYFVNKLHDYDYIVQEKEKQIDELTDEIKILLKNKAELDRYKTITLPKEKRKLSSKTIHNFKVPKYREENFFSNYKELKKKFDFDKEDLIKNFIKEHTDKKHEKDYKTLCNFKSKFDKEAIYQLMTLTSQEQYKLIKTILTDKEKELIDIDKIIKNKNRFTILKLFEKIDEMILEINPTINVYVSKYDKNYNYIDPYIKTIQYANMSEGIIIEYKGKRYDFSI